MYEKRNNRPINHGRIAPLMSPAVLEIISNTSLEALRRAVLAHQDLDYSRMDPIDLEYYYEKINAYKTRAANLGDWQSMFNLERLERDIKSHMPGRITATVNIRPTAPLERIEFTIPEPVVVHNNPDQVTFTDVTDRH